MINYKEIFEAWKVSVNPNQREEELAEKRLNVCAQCEFKKEILKGVKWSALCQKCGCPLTKKVFSKNFNSCPLKKWADIDAPYLELKSTKDINTLI